MIRNKRDIEQDINKLIYSKAHYNDIHLVNLWDHSVRYNPQPKAPRAVANEPLRYYTIEQSIRTKITSAVSHAPTPIGAFRAFLANLPIEHFKELYIVVTTNNQVSSIESYYNKCLRALLQHIMTFIMQPIKARDNLFVSLFDHIDFFDDANAQKVLILLNTYIKENSKDIILDEFETHGIECEMYSELGFFLLKDLANFHLFKLATHNIQSPKRLTAILPIQSFCEHVLDKSMFAKFEIEERNFWLDAIKNVVVMDNTHNHWSGEDRYAEPFNPAVIKFPI